MSSSEPIQKKSTAIVSTPLRLFFKPFRFFKFTSSPTLPDVVLEALSQHVAEFPTDGFVFTNGRGEPIRRSVFSRLWRRAVDASGVPAGTTFHDLRHHYASLLIRHGESVKVVRARLGHASAAETLDTYSHLRPDSEDRTRAAVDSVWRAVADYPRTETGG